MIDHLLGRPSTSLKRLQVLAVLAFWGTLLKKAPPEGPRRLRLVRWANRKAAGFAPWKMVLATLMFLYTLRHVDSIFGFGAPEPLARMYSRSFYRVTWIVTALDAGFATAMNVKPKWLRDILSMVFSAYYVLYANEADEKLRKYRAFCTLEMLRYTWEKTTNPYIRLATWIHRPSLPIARPILIPRPTIGPHSKRPIKAWLFYAGGKEDALAKEEELYLDFPGGGFICMNPQHHEERLRQLAKEVQRPILAIDYCKAPEYPYPFALEECFDVYRTLFETRGKAIGMSGSSRFRVILSGDSAGGNLATGVMFKILEYPQPHIKAAYNSSAIASQPPPLPKPLCMILAYPSLNFGFTAWMKPEHLRVLKAQSEVNLQRLQQAAEDSKAGRKGSPLRPRSRSRSRQASVVVPPATASSTTPPRTPSAKSSVDSSTDTQRYRMRSLASQAELHLADRARLAEAETPTPEEVASPEPQRWNNAQHQLLKEEEVVASDSEEQQRALAKSQQKADEDMTERRKRSGPVGTRLTMSSMSGYFQDRILTQSMMRAMAILYIGPRRQPDFDHDYFLSPVVAPASLLAQFPPVLFICGEKDPICDDTVIMAGRIREAKLARQAEVRRRRVGRFGEGLRMSSGSNNVSDPIEDEDVEDWVQMRIVAEVSHGFLQMSALWPQAKHIISFISAWTIETFEEEAEALEEQRGAGAAAITAAATTAATRSQTAPVATSSKPVENASGGPAVHLRAPSTDAEDDEPLSFTPKRLRSPSMQASSSPGRSPRLEGGIPSSPLRLPKPDLSPDLPQQGHHHPLGLPAMAALNRDRERQAKLGLPPGVNGSPSRSRPTSFSDVLVEQSRAASEQLVPNHHQQQRSASFVAGQGGLGVDVNEGSSPTKSSAAIRSSSPSLAAAAGVMGGSLPSARRGSRRRPSHRASPPEEDGAAAGDEQRAAFLVREASLLQRRRDEAVSGLGGASAVHSESEGEEEEDDYRGEEARGRRGTSGSHKNGVATRGTNGANAGEETRGRR